MSFLDHIQRIGRILRRVPATPVDPVRAAIEQGKCPDCGSLDFYEGPSGGLCVNYQCAGCGSRFNIGCAFDGTLLLVERI